MERRRGRWRRSFSAAPNTLDHSRFFFLPSLPPPPSYQASRDDLAVFAAMASKPDVGKYANAARWYAHISALLGKR
jgi:hypothetical protein